MILRHNNFVLCALCAVELEVTKQNHIIFCSERKNVNAKVQILKLPLFNYPLTSRIPKIALPTNFVCIIHFSIARFLSLH